tara:strand:+ start:248 stop:457 length:210 start_codon:yes stop_codon:yes gene_type:complete
MIEILDLNALHHVKRRASKQFIIRRIAEELDELPAAKREAVLGVLRSQGSPDKELSSVSRAELKRLGLV